MATDKRPHLLAYDIANPTRLRHIAKCAERVGIRLQYSFFLVWLTPDHRDNLLAKLSDIIDPNEDDIRLYPLTLKPQIHHQGRTSLPEGVLLFGESAVETLAFPTAGEEPK